MKKTKILMPIVATATTVATIAPALVLSSCGCSTKYNNPVLSTKTPKTKSVGYNSTRTYFLIEQKNIKEPEATKVKLTNLVVNGASVTPVAGIIKSTVDSAGNIKVVFNMTIVKQHYQAESITFDLLLTNKKANTSYTLTGFEVKIDNNVSTVNYDSDDNVSLDIAPDSVATGNALEIKFSAEDGYTFINSACDVEINGVSVVSQPGVVFDIDDEDGTITIPAEILGETPVTVNVILKTKPAVNKLTISGTRNIEADGSQTLTYTVVDQNKYDITNECTFDIVNDDFTDDSKKLGTFNANALTLTTYAKENGGSGTLTVTHTKSGTVDNKFAVEIASFNKLDATELKNGNALQKDNTVSGIVVIPSRYYLEDSTSWKDVTAIAENGFTTAGITGIVVSKNITTIPTQSFGKGLANISVNAKNTSFRSTDSSGNECNCVFDSSKVLRVGCANSIVPNDSNVVTSIGEYAFLNTQISSITLSDNITSISNNAFYISALKNITISSSVETIGKKAFCYTHVGDEGGSVTFTDTDAQYIQTGDTDKKQLNISNATTNGENFANASSGITGNNWGTTGIAKDTAAVLSAKVQLDTESFTGNGMPSASTTTTQVINKDGSKTINVTATAATADIKGYIVVTSSAGTQVLKSDLWTVNTTSTSRTVTISDWTNVKPQDTLTVSFISIFNISNGLITLSDKTVTGSLFVPTNVNSTKVVGVNSNGFNYAKISSITFETPANITTLLGSAFANCTNMTTCPIDETFTSLTTIGDAAFNQLRFASVTIPKSVVTIGNSAFAGTNGTGTLTSVTFESGSLLKTIGESAFCTNNILTQITIPTNVTSIGRMAFQGTSLSNAYFANTSVTWVAHGWTTPEDVTDSVSNAKKFIDAQAGVWCIRGLDVLETIELKFDSEAWGYYKEYNFENGRTYKCKFTFVDFMNAWHFCIKDEDWENVPLTNCKVELDGVEIPSSFSSEDNTINWEKWPELQQVFTITFTTPTSGKLFAALAFEGE